MSSSLDLPLSVDVVVDDTSTGLQDDVLALFDECAGGIRRYVSSFGLDAAATDDIVQEVFLALFRHLRLGRPRENLKGWLYRVAHNLSLKRRERGRRWQSEGEASLSGALQLIDPAANPEEHLSEIQRRRRLRAVARALPERDRRCLYLRAEGLGYRDIARTLGVSLGSVAKSLTRAFARLMNSETR